MLSFREFLAEQEEPVNYVHPNADTEHWEAHRYSALEHLDKPGWKKLVAKGKHVILDKHRMSTLSNNSASDKHSAGSAWHGIAPHKQKRVAEIMKKKEPVELPIILHHKGERHLVSGNTRITALLKHGHTPHALEIDSKHFMKPGATRHPFAQADWSNPQRQKKYQQKYPSAEYPAED